MDSVRLAIAAKTAAAEAAAGPVPEEREDGATDLGALWSDASGATQPQGKRREHLAFENDVKISHRWLNGSYFRMT